MPDNETARTKTTVTVVKQNWSQAQIDAALAHHGLAPDADLLPEHFEQAGIGEPENGSETHTFELDQTGMA